MPTDSDHRQTDWSVRIRFPIRNQALEIDFSRDFSPDHVVDIIMRLVFRTLDAEGAAGVLDCSPRSVRTLFRDAKLHCFHLNRTKVTTIVDLMELVYGPGSSFTNDADYDAT